MARSAGAYAQLVAREGKYATVTSSFGRNKNGTSYLDCNATIGVVTNSDDQRTRTFLVKQVEAVLDGLGRRPRTRPVWL